MDSKEDLEQRVEAFREVIDFTDDEILSALERRSRAALKVQKYKSRLNLPVGDKDREKSIINRLVSDQLSDSKIKDIWNAIFTYGKDKSSDWIRICATNPETGFKIVFSLDADLYRVPDEFVAETCLYRDIDDPSNADTYLFGVWETLQQSDTWGNTLRNLHDKLDGPTATVSLQKQ